MKPSIGIILAAASVILPGAAWAQTSTTPLQAAPPSTAAANSDGNAAPITLRLKYKPGQVIHYRSIVDGDGTLTMSSMPTGMPMKIHVVQTMTQKVTDVRASDGAATLSTHVDSVKVTMNGQDMPQPPASALSSSGTMTVGPTGEILSIVPAADAIPNPKAQAVLSGINALISKLSGYLPLLPVSVGSKWGEPVDLSMVGVQLAPGYTLKGLNTVNGATIADIGFKLTGNGDSSSSLIPVPLPGKIMARGDSGGDLTFDVGSGLITGQSMSCNLTVSLIPGKKTAAKPSIIPAGPMRLQAHANITMEKLPDIESAKL